MDRNTRLISFLLALAILALGAGPALAQSEGTEKKDDKKQEKAEKAEKKQDKAHPGLRDPQQATEKAPDVFKVKLETTAGDAVIEVHRDWAPLGADRFYNLVRVGYYDDVAFFRVITQPRKFMAQTGIHGDPAVNAIWSAARIQDDKPTQSNKRGTVTFGTSGPNSRTTHIFINYGDNPHLDQGFAPFGKIVEGMEHIDALHDGYGEMPRHVQPLAAQQGNAYFKKEYPELDYIKRATIVADEKNEK